MKTRSFKVLRGVCYLCIITTTLATLAYFAMFLYDKKILQIEKSLSGDSKITLYHISIWCLYLNLLLAALNGYAFNIASKMLLRGSIWLTCIVTTGGLVGALYLKYFAKDTTSILLQRGTFSNGMLLVLQHILNVPTSDYLQIQKMFMARYERLLAWFVVTELTSCGCFAIVIIGAVIRQFMKVHVVAKNKPNIVASTIVEPVSLRSNPLLIRVR